MLAGECMWCILCKMIVQYMHKCMHVPQIEVLIAIVCYNISLCLRMYIYIHTYVYTV